MVRVNLRWIWDRLRTSYWFVPLVMAVLAVLLAQLMLWIDAQISNETLSRYRIIFNQDAEQARVTLTNLAGTLLSTAGVVFTLLTLPLSLAASQFGSRLLRLYLRDRTTRASSVSLSRPLSTASLWCWLSHRPITSRMRRNLQRPPVCY